MTGIMALDVKVHMDWADAGAPMPTVIDFQPLTERSREWILNNIRGQWAGERMTIPTHDALGVIEQMRGEGLTISFV